MDFRRKPIDAGSNPAEAICDYMKIEEVLKNIKAYVWEEKFAVLKVGELPKNKEFFCVIIDKKETTLILKENDIQKVNAIEMEKDFRIITFNTILPFDLVGFMSAISAALTRADVSLLAISAYSTDHILVKEKNLNKTIEALKTLGIKIE